VENVYPGQKNYAKRVFVADAAVADKLFWGQRHQGCQILLGKTYQKEEKCTK
jgi:hypothetical protein